jgi:hypothetical protein
MTSRRPLVNVDGVISELPIGDSVAGGSAASIVFTTVEINLGSSLRRSGKFIITTSGLTVNKPVLIQQAAVAYTGKGTLTDEAEMDIVNVSAQTTSTTQITCYWNSKSPVKGNVKFNYLAGT